MVGRSLNPPPKTGYNKDSVYLEEIRMPSLRESAKWLKPFLFHGVDLDEREGSDQAIGACPFCGKEGKFCVSTKDGLWDCKVCGVKGNPSTFVRQLHSASKSATTDYSSLLASRRLISSSTLASWGVVRSLGGKEWLVPGYGIDGKVNQLYRYCRTEKGMRLLATPELNHQLHGVNLFDPKKETVYVCEGPWDGMALWEMLRVAKRTSDGGLTLTSNEEASLLGNANVIAVPGCSVFPPHWTPLLAGKKVVLLYDNDYPIVNGERVTPSAGYMAMKKVARVLSSSEEPPKSIHFLNWGEDGYDVDSPDGYDVRDLLSDSGNTPQERLDGLMELLELVYPIPEHWIEGRTEGAKKSGGTEIECVPCDKWEVLQLAWRKAMKWTDGLDRALTVMLGCVVSTKAVGDQLWAKIIGPPACGKSTLCEALSVAKKHVLAKSTIRGFHSGFQSDRGGTEDNSLIASLRDKTLVTKDGDTLLQSPNLGQILSEARDLYDSTSRTHYRNKMSRDYEGVRMTWILCGTSSLRSIDSSELGERFVDCVIMEEIDEELEDEILLRVAYRSERNMSFESNGRAEDQQDPDLTKAMQLTGGYINWLRENGRDLLASTVTPPWALQKCIHLGKFVAYMRARPSKQQDESEERELSTRLVSQHVRLMKCLAVVLNRNPIDEEVMRRVTQVALDTSRGKVLTIAKYLYDAGEEGLTATALSIYTNHKANDDRILLRFLRKIKAVKLLTKERNEETGRSKLMKSPKWILSDSVRNLYREVVVESDKIREEEGTDKTTS